MHIFRDNCKLVTKASISAWAHFVRHVGDISRSSRSREIKKSSFIGGAHAATVLRKTLGLSLGYAKIHLP